MSTKNWKRESGLHKRAKLGEFLVIWGIFPRRDGRGVLVLTEPVHLFYFLFVKNFRKLSEVFKSSQKLSRSGRGFSSYRSCAGFPFFRIQKSSKIWENLFKYFPGRDLTLTGSVPQLDFLCVKKLKIISIGLQVLSRKCSQHFLRAQKEKLPE
ncbi:MAG: hypothetical protein WC757_04420 [Candidatus Paceibacterota bacterium]